MPLERPSCSLRSRHETVQELLSGTQCNTHASQVCIRQETEIRNCKYLFVLEHWQKAREAHTAEKRWQVVFGVLSPAEDGSATGPKLMQCALLRVIACSKAAW